jgi:hypothetical protein
MKRNFLMKAFVCLFTVASFCSCSKDDDEKNENETSVIPNTFTVVVENGVNLNETIDSVKMEINPEKMYVITLVSTSYENGGFTLNLPESVSARYLDEDFEYEKTHGVTVSNPNAKTGWVGLYAYKSNSDIGGFFYETEDGEWEGEIVYSDSDVSVTGSYTESETTYTYKDTYNVYLKKGWNMIYSRGTDKGNNLHEYEETTRTPEGAKWKWYFFNWDDKNYAVSGSLFKSKTLSSKRKFGFK